MANVSRASAQDEYFNRDYFNISVQIFNALSEYPMSGGMVFFEKIAQLASETFEFPELQAEVTNLPNFNAKFG